MIPDVDSIRKLARARICMECDRRPLSLEYRSPALARPCEGDCAIFHTLSAMEQCLDSAARDAVGRREICRLCATTPTADFCTHDPRQCALLRDPLDVITVLQRLSQPS